MKLFNALFLFLVFGLINSNMAQSQTLEELNKKSMEYYKQGDYSNAIIYGEEVLKQAEKEYGNTHINYLPSCGNLARLFKSSGNYAKAVPLYEQVMIIQEKSLGEKYPDYSTTIGQLAFLYCEIGSYSKAEHLYQEELVILKNVLGDKHPFYAISLTNLANMYKIAGDYDKAEILCLESVKILKTTVGTNHPDYASAIFNLAELHLALGNYSEAESLYMEVMEIRKKTLGENHSDYAKCLVNLGVLNQLKGNITKAETMYLEATGITKKALGENHPDYASCISNLSTLYKDVGNYEKAKSLCIDALEIEKKTLGEASTSYICSLGNLATLYDDMGNYSKAESLYMETLEIRKKTLGESHPDYAISLSNLAGLYDEMGNYPKALEMYLIVLEITKKTLGESHRDYVSALGNLAACYGKMGNYSKVEPLLLNALEITKKELSENDPIYSALLNNLAGLYKNLGNYTKGESLYIEALEVLKKVSENHPNYASSLNNLAGLYIELGNYAKAEPLYLLALQIRKKALGESHPDYAASLNNLARLYIKLGNYAKAKPLNLKAVEILKKTLGENHSSYAAALNGLAVLYIKLGNYAKAKPLYLKAVEILKKTLGENHPDYATLLNSLALLYDNKGDYAKAEPLYLKASEIMFHNIKQQFSFLSEKEKELYLKALSGRFEHLNSIGLKGKESNPAIIVEIYNNQLKTKSLLLKSSIAMHNAVLSSNDEKLIAAYSQWTSLQKKISNIYHLPIEKRKEDLPKLESEANDLEKYLTRSSSVFSDLNSLLNVNWKDIQTQLKPNEVAIEFANFRYNKDSVLYCALIIKKDSEFPEMVPLFEEKQLTSLLNNLKENDNYSITSVYGSKKYTETKLYDVIWQPLEKYLKGIEIINYSPSGLLHKVSFAALSNADDHYLIDDYKLNMLTTTAMVAKPTQSVFDKNTAVSLFGGINYSINDTSQKPWNYLAGTLSETDQLNDAFKKQDIKVNYIKAKDATKQEFKNLAVNSNIIHIATHGFFFPEPKIIKTETDANKKNTDIVSRSASRAVELNYIRNDNPLMRSGLVFAGVNDYWNGITDDVDSNGVLTALEVVNIDLRKNKLVVLSACETGLGDIKVGEGVYGLQRAFKMAGTENIIMSLWQVPDKETSEFTQKFYTLLFIEQNISQAFAETQNLMRKKYDPYYWAAFVLVR